MNYEDLSSPVCSPASLSPSVLMTRRTMPMRFTQTSPSAAGPTAELKAPNATNKGSWVHMIEVLGRFARSFASNEARTPPCIPV